MEIVIGESVGDLKYGMSREEVEAIFGEPEGVVEKNEDGDLEFFYKQDTVEFIFYETDKYKLSNVIIDDESGIDVKYKGESLFEQSYDSLISVFTKDGGEPEYDDIDYEEFNESERCVDFESIGVTLYFNDNKELVEVSLSRSINCNI